MHGIVFLTIFAFCAHAGAGRCSRGGVGGRARVPCMVGRGPAPARRRARLGWQPTRADPHTCGICFFMEYILRSSVCCQYIVRSSVVCQFSEKLCLVLNPGAQPRGHVAGTAGSVLRHERGAERVPRQHPARAGPSRHVPRPPTVHTTHLLPCAFSLLCIEST